MSLSLTDFLRKMAISPVVLQAQSCVYNVGMDANTAGSPQQTQQAYNFTFERYLNEQLASTGCTFTMTLYSDPDSFQAAGVRGEVDIFFVGPGVFVCLQVGLAAF